MATTGTATIDFGTGNTDTKVVVTGQGAIAGGSFVEAWLSGASTANNLTDAAFVDPINVFAGDVVAATGFTIYAFCRSGRAFGQFTVSWVWV